MISEPKWPFDITGWGWTMDGSKAYETGYRKAIDDCKKAFEEWREDITRGLIKDGVCLTCGNGSEE